MPTATDSIKAAIQSPEALQRALLTATTTYLSEREEENKKEGNATVSAETKKGFWHGENGLRRAQHLKALAEENKNDLIALFALLYVVMSPYTLFGPISALDAINRSNWLANALAEAMITGEYFQVTDLSSSSFKNSLKSAVLTKKYLADTLTKADVMHIEASQVHSRHTYDKSDALRWTASDVRNRMEKLAKRDFDAKVGVFSAKCKETDEARITKGPREKNADDTVEMEIRTLAAAWR